MDDPAIRRRDRHCHNPAGGAVADITLTPAGIPPAPQLVLSFWVGWAITLGVAELWIRNTRTSPGPPLMRG